MGGQTGVLPPLSDGDERQRSGRSGTRTSSLVSYVAHLPALLHVVYLISR